MKLHNSTDIGNESSYQQKKFKIRYQQSHSFSLPKKCKTRYLQNNDTSAIRNCLLSETDVYHQQKISQIKQLSIAKQLKTERPKCSTVRSPYKKNIGSVADLINTINKSEVETPKMQKEVEKDFPRIPIQYNQEKLNGSGAEIMRLKVIYRGYAPKNTYYFLKSLAFNQLQVNPSIKRNFQFQLQFQSKFQSGNLSVAARKSQKQFYIYMREDTNTYGLRQWYYFHVTNKKAGKFKFRIYKFSKFYSLYKQGMKPFVRVVGENNEWRQSGENVKYQFDNETKSHFLQFEYQFLNDAMTVQFATQPPYTYSMLRDFLKLLIQKYPSIKILKAGQSLSGLDIPKIQISTKPISGLKKKVIIILARTHPGQTASNWSLQAFIDRVFQIPELKIYYDFHIIPMVNPDGVFLGNHRTGVMGQDINRNFTGTDFQYFPEIQAIQKLIQQIKNQRQKQIQFLIDLHGHSARRNIFAFGDQHPVGTNQFLLTHILPKLLNDHLSSFKYNFCVFRASKQKKNTARVFLSRKYKINALTFEQSYGMLDQGTIGIQNWRNFGIALADILKQFYQLFMNGSFLGLQNYLSKQILYQTQKNERRAKKKSGVSQQLKTQSNVKKDTTNTQKFKTESGYTNIQFGFKGLKYQIQNQIQQKQDQDSINSEQLSSGDEQLQNTEQGMQLIKKQIIKIGCLKQGTRRQKYNLAQRNIQIKNSNFEPRLHQQRSSMVPRILKFQMKKRQQITFLKYNEQRHKRRLNITQKLQRQSIQLPNLRK